MGTLSVRTFDNCRLMLSIFDTRVAGLTRTIRFNRLLGRYHCGFGKRLAISRFGTSATCSRYPSPIRLAGARFLWEEPSSDRGLLNLDNLEECKPDLGGRQLVIDLTNVTVISREGEDRDL